VAGIWFGTRLEAFTVSEVKVFGGQTVDHEEIISLVEKNLQGTYLGLIPKKFTLMYPKQNIVESVETVERVYDVMVQRNDRRVLEVSFSEFSPKALWCQGAESDECIFLDETGYAFGEAPDLAGGSLVRFISSGSDIEVGARFSDEQVFSKLFIFVESLSEFGWFVSQVELDQVGDAFVQLGQNSEIKITTAEDPQTLVYNLTTVTASEDFNHLTPGNFQYIDLRYGNKVFINEEELVIESNLSTSTESVSDDASLSESE